MKGDKTVNITIKGGGVTLNIPVIPSKVNVSDGSSTPKTVTIWRKGEVDFNDGKSLDGLSWSSFFPSRYDASYCNNKSLKTVQWYINTINKWKNAGTVVQVIIPAMNINRSMKIKTFQGDYEGQELDYYYDLEFKGQSGSWYEVTGKLKGKEVSGYSHKDYIKITSGKVPK